MLKARFISVPDGSKVVFAVGGSFDKANGTELSDIAKSVLRVPFPYSIFFLVEHSKLSAGQEFSFEFWFLDEETTDEID